MPDDDETMTDLEQPCVINLNYSIVVSSAEYKSRMTPPAITVIIPLCGSGFQLSCVCLFSACPCKPFSTARKRSDMMCVDFPRDACDAR
jgi:hypothetical protein